MRPVIQHTGRCLWGEDHFEEILMGTGNFLYFGNLFCQKRTMAHTGMFFLWGQSILWNFDGNWISFLWRGLFLLEIDDPTYREVFLWRKSDFWNFDGYWQFFVFWEPFSSKMDDHTYWDVFFGAHSFWWIFDGNWFSFLWRGLFSSETDDPTSWNFFCGGNQIFETSMGTEMVFFILETFFGWSHTLGVFFGGQFWYVKFRWMLGTLFWVTPFVSDRWVTTKWFTSLMGGQRTTNEIEWEPGKLWKIGKWG